MGPLLTFALGAVGGLILAPILVNSRWCHRRRHAAPAVKKVAAAKAKTGKSTKTGKGAKTDKGAKAGKTKSGKAAV